MRKVSTHAPARGATARLNGDPTRILCFNSRAREGRDFSGVVSTIPIYQEGAVNGPRVIYDLHIMAPGAAFDNPPRSGDRVRYHGEVYRVTKVQHGGIARAWHLDCNPIK